MDRPKQTAKKAVLWKYIEVLEKEVEGWDRDYKKLAQDYSWEQVESAGHANRVVALQDKCDRQEGVIEHLKQEIEGLHREVQADRKVAEITETALKSCESANRDLHNRIEQLEKAIVEKFVKDMEGRDENNT